MNSIWNPTLVINGLLVPVQLFNLARKSKIALEMFDSRDMNRITMPRKNPKTNQPVPAQFIGKCYNDNGVCTLVSPELIAQCLPPVSNQVVFDYFIDGSAVSYSRIETFYAALPVPGDGLNYALVLHSLQTLNVAGIARATYMNCCNQFALGVENDILNPL